MRQPFVCNASSGSPVGDVLSDLPRFKRDWHRDYHLDTLRPLHEEAVFAHSDLKEYDTNMERGNPALIDFSHAVVKSDVDNATWRRETRMLLREPSYLNWNIVQGQSNHRDYTADVPRSANVATVMSQRTTKNFLDKKRSNSLGLSAGMFCNLLGIDPHDAAPDYATMRRYIRRLHLLLHPDRILGSDEAKRAQEELKFDFKGLRDVEDYLCASESWYGSRIAGLYKMAIQDDSWVSTWNPHSLGGGDVFEPLPSFVMRMNSKQAPNPGQPAGGNSNDHSHGAPPRSAPPREYAINDMLRINIFAFRPSSWVGVPPFHGAGQEKTTHALLRFIGCSPVTGGPNFGVSVAAVELRWGSRNFEAAHMTADAVVELPPFGHIPSPGSLTVQLLLKNRRDGEDVTLSWLSTVAPIHLRDLTNEWSDCPGPWSHEDPCPWTRNRMSMRIEWWYGVFASDTFVNSEIKMSYINDFLQQVREALN